MKFDATMESNSGGEVERSRERREVAELWHK